MAYPPSSWHTRCSSRINSQINPTFNVLGLDKDKHHPFNYSNIQNALEKTFSILLKIRNEIEKPKGIPSTVPFIREATKFYFQNEKKWTQTLRDKTILKKTVLFLSRLVSKSDS